LVAVVVVAVVAVAVAAAVVVAAAVEVEEAAVVGGKGMSPTAVMKSKQQHLYCQPDLQLKFLVIPGTFAESVIVLIVPDSHST